MKVARISSFNIYQTQEKPVIQTDQTKNVQIENVELPNYQVAFGGIFPHKLNVEGGKSKLLRNLRELLEIEIQEAKEVDSVMETYRKLLVLRHKILKYTILRSYAGILSQRGNFFSMRDAYAESAKVAKEIRRMEKQNKSPKFKPTESKKDENPLDFKLLHSFETSIQDDKFDLLKVFWRYYGKIADMTTLDELQKTYPKIALPRKPEDVVSDKFINCLTRDFYEALDDVFETKDAQKIEEFILQKIHRMISDVVRTNKKLHADQEEPLYQRLVDIIAAKILKKYENIYEKNAFSSVAENKKIKIPQLTDNDLTLLSVNYDEFILKVLKEQYLGYKKPNDIVIDGIKISAFKDPEYKFEIIPRPIQNIIKQSLEVHNEQRNYDIYATNDLKSRLLFFSDRIDADDNLLEQIISFASCKFEKDDINMLKLFLKELDCVYDGDKTVAQIVESVRYKGIHPLGTARINEIERQKAIEQFKAEQKKLATLLNEQNVFDETINLLYENDLPEIAEVCSKYRPTSLDVDEINTSKLIIKIIRQNRSISDKNSIENPKRLGLSIARWNTYHEYKTSELNDDVLKKAEQYARTATGEIDVDSAGKYIMNYEFVENYPASMEFTQNKELVQKIMASVGKEKHKGITYLCKLDDFLDLPIEKRSHIDTITGMFNIKDDVEKTMIKHFLENEYTKIDTNDYLNIKYAGSKKVQTTITAKAKQEIMEHYKFPKCIKFYQMFEDAMTKLAKTRATSGIKPLGTHNNVLADVYELKIKGYDDRILSYDGTYRFDTFDSTGLH